MIRKLSTLIRMTFQELIEYRGDMLIYTISSFVLPLVLMALWTSLASYNGSTLNAQYLINYFYWQMLISIITGAWFAPFTANDIRKGKLSFFLLMPLDFIWFWIADNIGEKIFKLVIAVPLFLCIGFFLKSQILLPSSDHLFLFIITLIPAAAIRFLIERLIATAAFWVSNINALNNYDDILFYATSGKLFPLSYLSNIISPLVLFILPYRYVLGFPLDVLLTNMASVDIIQGLLAGSAWVLFLYCTTTYLWKKGLQVYGAFGA